MKDLYNIDDWNDVSCRRLGEILIEAGKINLFHLSMVLDIQRFQKIPMGQIFLSMKVITKKDLKQALLVQKMIQKRCGNA
ncbi:MAG: hypothetical protein LUG16_05130 [Candidatus Gastranaerophilales bacterium]|nr:hypothetical protein [Candidatus Gastranaerophilales bacterium]